MCARTWGAAALIAVWSVLPAGGAAAQPRTPAAESRRDEFAKVQEALADPDPSQRLANLEAIVQQNDPLRTQLAIRTAFASDDAALRGLAMQALLATTSEFTFDIAPPFAETNALSTRRDIPREERRVTERLAHSGYRLHLVIKDYRFPAMSGAAEALTQRPATFAIRGRRFSAQLLTGFGKCYVDFAPTPKLELEGTLACEGGWPSLAIRSAVF